MRNRAKRSTVDFMFALAFCFCINSFAQTVHPAYVDGKIWVKLNAHEMVPPTISNTSDELDIITPVRSNENNK